MSKPRCGQEMCPWWPGDGCVDGVVGDCPPDVDSDEGSDR